MTITNADTAKEKASLYVDSIVKLSREYGFMEDISEKAIEEAKLEIEKVTRKFQGLREAMER